MAGLVLHDRRSLRDVRSQSSIIPSSWNGRSRKMLYGPLDIQIPTS